MLYSPTAINFDSNIPYYIQLMEVIEAKIRSQYPVLYPTDGSDRSQDQVW